MPNSSSPTTNGNPLRNATCLVYAPGPLVAKALEKKCSIRKKPIGMIPLSECRRRRRNECPRPSRNGATPPLALTGVAALGDDATAFLMSSGMTGELFIMLVTEKGIQVTRPPGPCLDICRRYCRVQCSAVSVRCHQHYLCSVILSA